MNRLYDLIDSLFWSKSKSKSNSKSKSKSKSQATIPPRVVIPISPSVPCPPPRTVGAGDLILAMPHRSSHASSSLGTATDSPTMNSLGTARGSPTISSLGTGRRDKQRASLVTNSTPSASLPSTKISRKSIT